MTAPFQLFPALDAATEAALRAGIERFGVLVPIAVDQHGNILDGHHRRRIADELGRDYQTNHHVVADDDEAREIARMLNADRRQLTDDQRLAMAVHLRKLNHSYRAIAGVVGGSHEQVRQDLATVNDLTVETVVGLDGKRRKAKRTATVSSKNKREADRVQQVLDVVAELIPATVVDVKRAERLAREHEAARRRLLPVEDLTLNDVEIRHGDFRATLFDLKGTVDAIITDPPYEAAFVANFIGLAELAANLLTANGVLAVMTGQLYLPQYLKHLSTYLDLEYRWVGCYLTDGPRSRVHAAHVAQGWKPILLYQRPGAEPPFLVDDVFRSQADDKEHHHWGQSESGMASLVERLTAPGQLVVDPFLGGGTTAVVCRDLGRRFVGCDVDAAAIHATQERLSG